MTRSCAAVLSFALTLPLACSSSSGGGSSATPSPAGGNGGSGTAGKSSGGASGKGGGGNGGSSGKAGGAAGLNGGTGAGGGAGGSNGGAGAQGGTAPGGAAGSGRSGSGGAAGSGVWTKRTYPDSSSAIRILADQLPSGLTSGQQKFAATHYVGSQKLLLADSTPLRAINPDFLVLHYHLGIWQSAPGVDFIVDGMTWSNDFPMVDMHESWFFHNEQGQRLASTMDKKLLMNLNDPDFRTYWATSIAQQVKAGQYDGVFADSSSPALLQGEVGNQDPRLAGTGAKDTPIAEWGGKTYIDVWNDFMASLDAALAAEGIPLLPNQGAFVTTWDTSNYDQTAGVFSEGFASPSFVTSDWKASTNELLKLSASKILILQNYLQGPDDLAHRKYYLANYLLVRGARTYLDYFASGPLEWYPEWGIDTGAAMTTGTTVDDLATAEGIYRRDFQKVIVLVNPTDADVTVQLGVPHMQIVPQGGGPIDDAGDEPGSISTMPVIAVDVPAHGAEILAK